MDSTRGRLVERSKYYRCNLQSHFYEASNRFDILCNGQSFDPAIDIYYHKSCCVKYAINPMGNSQNLYENEDKNTKDEVLYKFNRTIRIRIVRNKEAFLLHHILSYLKKLCDDCEIEPILNHTVSLKRELLGQFENEIDFSPRENSL